jgi:hypothetical protein
VAGAAVATTLPAVAAAVTPSHHPDAELFGLIERTKADESASLEAAIAADTLLDEMRPSSPPALMVRDRRPALAQGETRGMHFK